MSLRQSLTVGGDRFRVRPWHAEPTAAYLAPSPESGPPTSGSVAACVAAVEDAGYRSIMTSALHPDEAHAFLLAGFEVHDRLCVLAHDLSEPPASTDPGARGGPHWSRRLRRARRRDRAAALAVDAAAFPAEWQLDATGLVEAIDATPRHRFRVCATPTGLVGYAVTGRAGAHAFLQRLATHPDHQRTGVATALVHDAIRWSRRARSSQLLVNTQLENTRARSLYRRLGFRPTPTELVVLTKVLR